MIDPNTWEGKQPPPRVVLDAVLPEIDGGRHAAKSSAGEAFTVTAHLFADGHDLIAADLLHRVAGTDAWTATAMTALGNDEWQGSFHPTEIGMHEYTVAGWIDHFGSWLADLRKRVEADWDVNQELLEGGALVAAAAGRAPASERRRLREIAELLGTEDAPQRERIAAAEDPALEATMRRRRKRTDDQRYARVLPLWVDRERARFGAWYEWFPRSATADPSRGATLREAARDLPRIANMRFDVLYLPPVHPIGATHRKGPNNALVAGPDDLGSPWAIGSPDGGHEAVHPELGSVADFEWFVEEAQHHGLEVALDIAFQCSPDHPWVREQPQWFKHRPDGSIRYAENPPKQYQDIYPINFDTPDWRALWQALHDVVETWIKRGVRIFRVDNPHTKPFPFWEWLITTLHEQYPDVIFLAEAFTRPKRMYGLAKLGFTQSYTYFTWRNEKQELTDYLRELTEPLVRDFFRGNLFANTPDILHEYLQHGGRPAFRARLVLAATLGPSYGIYSGFELQERTPREPGSEEYLDSEKFQVRPRDWDHPDSLANEIATINAARRRYTALQHNYRLWFLPVDNPHLLAYVKSPPDGGAVVITAVNLDPHAAQDGWIGLPLVALGMPAERPFTVYEVLSDRYVTWSGEWNYVRLDPSDQQAHIFAFEPPRAQDAGEAVAP